MRTQRLDWRARAAIALENHQSSLACIVSFAILMALHRSYDIRGMQFDAGQYWALAVPSVLVNMPSPRGYVFPALLVPLRYLCDVLPNPDLVFRLGLSAVYAVALALLVPAAFQQAFGGKVTFVRRLVPVVLLAAIFPGLLLYSLSDLPALLLALGGLCLALRGTQQATAARFAGMLAASGALMAAAYNTRTIYLFALAALLTLLAIRGPRVRTAFPRWLGIAAAVAGIVAVSLPQLVINKRTTGVASLGVQSRVDNHNLFSSQLVWGMTLQRYETTISPDAPAPTVFYLDPAGEKLFNDVAAQGDLFSLPYYLKVVALHPLHFLALFSRHAINGLDVRDGIVYTRKPSPLRTRTALFNFAVLALAGWVAWSIRARSGSPPPGFRPAPGSWPLSLALLLLPVAAIVPGAIETRFFLPLHLLAYCTIAFHFHAAGLRQSVQQHGAAIAITLVAAAGLFFTVTRSTMAELQYGWPDLYRHGLPPKQAATVTGAQKCDRLRSRSATPEDPREWPHPGTRTRLS